MKSLSYYSLIVIFLATMHACSPTVEVEVPNKPITINLNVKIEHEIKVQVDQELEALFEEEEDLF